MRVLKDSPEYWRILEDNDDWCVATVYDNGTACVWIDNLLHIPISTRTIRHFNIKLVYDSMDDAANDIIKALS